MTDENNCLHETLDGPFIKVSSTSRTGSIAGAIAGIIRENQKVDIQAIGPYAVNQSVKAVAMARQFLIQDGIDIVLVPSFRDIEIDGQQTTAIFMEVIKR